MLKMTFLYTSVSLPGDAIPFSGRFDRALTAPPMTKLEMLCIFGNLFVAFSRHVCSLPGFSYSVSLNMDMRNPTVPWFPRNLRIALLITIAVWPEKMCQWNCTGLPVISFCVHECRRGPYFSKICCPRLVCSGVLISNMFFRVGENT